MCEETVQRYADLMETEEGRAKFPPILLFRDSDNKLWLVDGHHRVEAALRQKSTEILAEIRSGTKADALWAAAEINSKNALPLNKDDISNAVRILHDAWPDRSNVMIAEALGCHEKTVRKYRQPCSGSDGSEPEKRVGKDGKSYPAKKQNQRIFAPKTEIVSDSEATKTTQEVQAVDVPDAAADCVVTQKDTSTSLYAFSETPLRKLYGHYDQVQLAKDLIEAFSAWSISGLPFAIFNELCKNPSDKANVERMMHHFLNGYIIRQNESQYKPLLEDLFGRMYGDEELADKIMDLIAKEEKNYAL